MAAAVAAELSTRVQRPPCRRSALAPLAALILVAALPVPSIAASNARAEEGRGGHLQGLLHLPKMDETVIIGLSVGDGGHAGEMHEFDMSTGTSSTFAHNKGHISVNHLCDGFDEQWGHCEELPDCGPCTPQDCVFGEWGDWTYFGGCTGIATRTRGVEVQANECGKPCDGASVETKHDIKDQCKGKGPDCQFTEWSEWTQCRNKTDQSARTRSIATEAGQGGIPCEGLLAETIPCGGPVEVDCTFGAWQQWTSCSTSCGEGRHTRMRRIVTRAKDDGQLCDDMTLETARCMSEPCPSQDCTLSEWTDWTQCTPLIIQRTRRREILQRPEGPGKPCDSALEETTSCPTPDPVDCIVEDWEPWSECTKQCGGGQRERSRGVLQAQQYGGECPMAALKEVEPCNDQDCSAAAPEPCVLSQWSMWSTCSMTCGSGSSLRNRLVESDAKYGGEPCLGSLKEARSCDMRPCPVQNCLWGQWDPWSACSASCGGGAKRRSRHIEKSPKNGGGACAALDKSEVAPCNTQSCQGKCIDGRWGEWQEWSECSDTCSGAYKSRRRYVDVQPNACGKAPVGLREEYIPCTGLPDCNPDMDCQLSSWGEWSQCSCSCFGTRERNRYIETFASGSGLPCQNTALKVMEPCNPGPEENTPGDCSDTPMENCVMGEWESWSRCSVTCGGGQRARRRRPRVPARNGGDPCEDSLVETDGCSLTPCSGEEQCQDCQWEDWGDWGACTHCGGQRERHRSVRTMPNRCGTPCELESAKEVTDCTSKCEETMFCAWSEWSSTTCGGCGNTTSLRKRELHMENDESSNYFFAGSEMTKCAGSQLENTKCDFERPCRPPCQPVDCHFGVWSDWTEPTCTGLCERQRVIEKMNNECGNPCMGPLLETEECPVECDAPVDCLFADWEAWSICTSPDMQKTRSREIERIPSHGGEPCDGVLKETVSCNEEEPEACSFEEWSTWTPCSSQCGAGYHQRDRTPISMTSFGDFECRGPLKELGACKGEDPTCSFEKPVDCELSDWGEWSPCASDGQRNRDRRMQTMAMNGGKGCEGALMETETCEKKVRDCQISDWTDWDTCDRTCGSGQTHRQRQIELFPQNGGENCPSELIQTEGCNLKACIVRDAELGQWSTWSDCNKDCGPGELTRTREVLRLRDPGGKGVEGALMEYKGCENTIVCETTDCEWNDWEDWSDCTCKCDGGQKRRTRHIKEFPSAGGKICSAEDTEEIAKCSMQPCSQQNCTDGKWGSWSAWSPCSATADGGTTFRSRQMEVMADDCGCPPDGKQLETAFCNTDASVMARDCRMQDWTDWSACTATCDGITRRSRKVEEYGRGTGSWCDGAMKEVWPCNPGPNEDAAEECRDNAPPEDCEMSDWTDWSVCSKSCDGGEHLRTRTVVKYPAHRGKECDHSIQEVVECNRHSCSGPQPVDCNLGVWQEWGECDMCSGERYRLREVVSYPENGGQECNLTDMQEVGACHRRCENVQYCAWDTWGAWSPCTATCGKGGKRHRRRHLHLTDEAKEMLPKEVRDQLSSVQRLFQMSKELESKHSHEVFLSFLAGCGSIVAAVIGMRLFTSMRSHQRQPAARGYSDIRVSQRGVSIPEEASPAGTGYDDIASEVRHVLLAHSDQVAVGMDSTQ